MSVTGSAWQDRLVRLVAELHDGTLIYQRARFVDRPPVGPAIAGRRAAGSGRGHRRSHTAQARARRAGLALHAHRLRCAGMSVRGIADQLGLAKTTVGRWLVGIRPGGAEEIGPLYRVRPASAAPRTVEDLASPAEAPKDPAGHLPGDDERA